MNAQRNMDIFVLKNRESKLVEQHRKDRNAEQAMARNKSSGMAAGDMAWNKWSERLKK